MTRPVPLDVYSLPFLEGAAVPLAAYDPQRASSGATYIAPQILTLSPGHATAPILPSWPRTSGGIFQLDAPLAVTIDSEGVPWSNYGSSAYPEIPASSYLDYASNRTAGIEDRGRSTAERGWVSLPRASSLPAWAEVAARRLNLLAAVPVESPGGRPLNLDDVAHALVFLSRVMTDGTQAPWIGRLSSGGLQLSWRSGDGEVEVEAVFDKARNERTVILAIGDEERELPADEAYGLFAQVAGRLPRRELARS
jgi:hypothetical protein